MSNNNIRKFDPWSKKAKDLGYPSRAFFKIQEIDEKFKLTKNAKNCLDLGAAPGGWSLYLSQKNMNVTSIDLLDMNIGDKFFKQKEKINFIKGDFYKSEEALKKYLPFDLIVSDMAPNTSGNKIVDCQTSLELCLSVLEFSKKHLKKEGFLLFKFFQGEDNQGELGGILKNDFKNFKFYKPNISRNFSFEMFGLGFFKK